MKWTGLIFANLRHHWLSVVLSMLLFAMATALSVVLLLISYQISEQRIRNLGQTDLVIGAKGSPLQLILSTVYQTDVPTGNIDFAEAQKWMRHPTVKQAIPLAIGDSYQTVRIVGTDTNYATMYGGSLKTGKWWTKPMEVVIGSQVSSLTGLKNGDEFQGAHGLIADSAEVHSEHSYKVVGILAPTYTLLDRLILTDVASVWELHADHNPDTTPQITAVLISVKGPMGILQLPKQIQNYATFQVAVPATEMARLSQILGEGTEWLSGILKAMLVLAGISVGISMWLLLKARQSDLAMLRLLGAKPIHLFWLLMGEALCIALIGSGIGWMIGHILTHLLGKYLQSATQFPFVGNLFLRDELYVVGFALVAALLAGAIPAFQSYRSDISRILRA